MTEGDRVPHGGERSDALRSWGAYPPSVLVPWAFAWSGALVLQALGAWAFPAWPLEGVLGFAVTFGSVSLVVLGVAALVPPLPPRAVLGLVVPLTCIAFAAWLQRGAGAGGVSLGPALLVAGGLLGGASILGSVIGSRIEHVSHLALVAYVSSAADLHSVLSATGVSAQIVEHEPTLALLALSWALPGVPGLVPVLGVGDMVVATLYLAAAAALGLPRGRALLAMALGFFAVFLALIVWEVALPALPFLGVAFVVLHPESLRVRPQDRRAAVLGFVVATGLFLVPLMKELFGAAPTPM